MPVVRLCPYCKRSFLKSTYEMYKHIQTHHPEKIPLPSHSNKHTKKLKKHLIYLPPQHSKHGV